MWKKARWLIPHAAILICNMYIVFYAIDRVNTAMNFIDNRLTKGLLLILCAAGLYDWRRLTRAAAPAKPARQDAKPASGATRAPATRSKPAAAQPTESPAVSRRAARMAREEAARAAASPDAPPAVSRRAARMAREEAARRREEAQG